MAATVYKHSIHIQAMSNESNITSRVQGAGMLAFVVVRIVIWFNTNDQLRVYLLLERTLKCNFSA